MATATERQEKGPGSKTPKAARKIKRGQRSKAIPLGDGIFAELAALVRYPPPPVKQGPSVALPILVADADAGVFRVHFDAELPIEIFPSEGRLPSILWDGPASEAVERCKRALASLEVKSAPDCWESEKARCGELFDDWKRSMEEIRIPPGMEGPLESQPVVREALDRWQSSCDRWLKEQARAVFEARLQVFMSAAESRDDQVAMIYVAAYVACLDAKADPFSPRMARQYLRELEAVREEYELRWQHGANLNPAQAEYSYATRLPEDEAASSRVFVDRILSENTEAYETVLWEAEAESSVWERTDGLAAFPRMASRLLAPTMAFLDRCQTRGQRLALLDAAIDRVLAPYCWGWEYLGLAYEWRRHVEQQALQWASRILGSVSPAMPRPKFAASYSDWDEDDVWLHQQIFEGEQQAERSLGLKPNRRGRPASTDQGPSILKAKVRQIFDQLPRKQGGKIDWRGAFEVLDADPNCRVDMLPKSASWYDAKKTRFTEYLAAEVSSKKRRNCTSWFSNVVAGRL